MPSRGERGAVSTSAGATHVALLRGINVGRAKRVGMAELRALVEKLGYREARTLLNSGNVVFAAPGQAGDHATRIEAAITKTFGFGSRVTVLTVDELAAAVEGNPLLRKASDPARLLVVFLTQPDDRARLVPLAKRDWSPEALGLGTRVAYLWCVNGIIDSQLLEAVGQALGDAQTARNWTTVTKLLALARPAPSKAAAAGSGLTPFASAAGSPRTTRRVPSRRGSPGA
jgi:uncharacterized protein (DUF1697 family)